MNRLVRRALGRRPALVGVGVGVGVIAGPAPGAFAGPAVQFRLIARSGDAFPDRPGHVYLPTSTPFIGARSGDASGDLYFMATAQDPSGATLQDLLVYRQATGAVEAYARSGEVLSGLPVDQTWGAVGGFQPGVVGHIATLHDPVLGDRRAVLVSGPDGRRDVAARDQDQPPGYEQPAAFTQVGLASGSFNDVNTNRAGAVSFGARFRDAGGVLRYGYYLTQPGGTPERIVDSTMPVPAHPDAQWVASDGISAPFDIYTPGLDGRGNAFFRAKYRENGRDYRVFYKRTTDGGFTVIADAGSTDHVPGLPGHAYSRFRSAANNQSGDAAFAADLLRPDGTAFGSGVFLAREGQPVEKVLARGDAIPALPEAQTHTPGLISMNEAGHLLLTLNYAVDTPSGSVSGQSLLLRNPDGGLEPVLRFNQTPGFADDRAGATLAADLNARGDAVFITRMSVSPQSMAAFAYINATDTLVPILKTGDTLDGLTVVGFSLGGGANEPLGSVAASAGPVSWDDAGRLSLSVTLRDAEGRASFALYAVRVPSPSGAGVCLLAACGPRRRRSSL